MWRCARASLLLVIAVSCILFCFVFGSSMAQTCMFLTRSTTLKPEPCLWPHKGKASMSNGAPVMKQVAWVLREDGEFRARAGSNAQGVECVARDSCERCKKVFTNHKVGSGRGGAKRGVHGTARQRYQKESKRVGRGGRSGGEVQARKVRRRYDKRGSV